MRHVRVIHWKPSEAAPLVEAVRSAGFVPDFEPELRPTHVPRAIRESVPVAILIDLSSRPAMGREVGAMLRGVKHCRHIPLIFVDGAPDKVENVRAVLPDALFARCGGLAGALQKATSEAGTEPMVVPPPFMDRYKERTVAQKLGVEAGKSVAVLDAPPDYPAILGDLPGEGALEAVVEEDPADIHPVTLYFVHDPEGLLRAARRLRAIAPRTKAWVIWRKGAANGVTQNSVRETCLEFGLVDYKICALDGRWSGMLFARRKTGADQ